MADPKSILEEESTLRWGFLEAEKDACAVVSDRMELVYMNEAARRIVPPGWFGRRCFELFPTANDLCAFHCPTIAAVHEGHEILYCEEVLRVEGGAPRELGVAVIPLEGVSGDEACSLLLLRPKHEVSQDDLLSEARELKATVFAKFDAHSGRRER